MALTACPACATQVSTGAATCPKCGHQIRNPTTFRDTIILLVLAGVFAGVGWIVYQELEYKYYIPDMLDDFKKFLSQ